MKLLIKNGTLVLKDGEKKADLLIDGGRIVALGENLSADCAGLDAAGENL